MFTSGKNDIRKYLLRFSHITCYNRYHRISHGVAFLSWKQNCGTIEHCFMMNEPTPSTDKPLLFERYRVKQQIGTGRLATVYHATDERLQRDVLVHVFRKDLIGQEPLRQRFIHEINASAQCTHSALLSVFDSGDAGDRPFMVTEYIAGRPLNAVGALAINHALMYTRQVTGAVLACLSRGHTPPPISSRNVLLVNEEQIKLVESWLMPADEVAFDLAHYRAPELAEGGAPSHASVVYALGCLLYELITGTRPVSGADAQTVIQAHTQIPISSLSETRPLLHLPTLERLITRAMARFPEHRFADVSAFSEEIDGFIRLLNNETQRIAITPSIPKTQQRVSPAVTAQIPSPASAPTIPTIPSTPATASPSKEAQTAPGSKVFDPLQQSARKQKPFTHALLGWIVMIALLVGVIFGSYTLASFAVDKLFAIQLPQPSLESLGVKWPPDWLGGDETGEVLVVSIASNEGLNLRDAPGISTNVIATVPNGTLVRKLDDRCTIEDQGTEKELQPCTLDGVQWVRVRTDNEDGKSLEGWMSLLFLKKVDQQ